MLKKSIIRALVNATYKAFIFYLKGRTSNRYSLPLIGSVRQRRERPYILSMDRGSSGALDHEECVPVFSLFYWLITIHLLVNAAYKDSFLLYTYDKTASLPLPEWLMEIEDGY